MRIAFSAVAPRCDKDNQLFTAASAIGATYPVALALYENVKLFNSTKGRTRTHAAFGYVTNITKTCNPNGATPGRPTQGAALSCPAPTTWLDERLLSDASVTLLTQRAESLYDHRQFHRLPHL